MNSFYDRSWKQFLSIWREGWFIYLSEFPVLERLERFTDFVHSRNYKNSIADNSITALHISEFIIMNREVPFKA